MKLLKKAPLLAVAFLLLFSACKNHKLLEINASAKITDGNSIHNLINTANYTDLIDSVVLAKYLTAEEVAITLSGNTSTTYKLFRPITEVGSYKVIALLASELSGKSTNYTFFLRTYDAEHKMKDSFVFATWDDTRKNYVSSTLTENLVIKRTYNGDAQTWQISNTGRFILSSAR